MQQIMPPSQNPIQWQLTSSLKPKQRSTTSPDRPPTSPPRAINNTKSEDGSAERVSRSTFSSLSHPSPCYTFGSRPHSLHVEINNTFYKDSFLTLNSVRFISSCHRAILFCNTTTEVHKNSTLLAQTGHSQKLTVLRVYSNFVHALHKNKKQKGISCIADFPPSFFFCRRVSLLVVLACYLTNVSSLYGSTSVD